MQGDAPIWSTPRGLKAPWGAGRGGRGITQSEGRMVEPRSGGVELVCGLSLRDGVMAGRGPVCRRSASGLSFGGQSGFGWQAVRYWQWCGRGGRIGEVRLANASAQLVRRGGLPGNVALVAASTLGECLAAQAPRESGWVRGAWRRSPEEARCVIKGFHSDWHAVYLPQSSHCVRMSYGIV